MLVTAIEGVVENGSIRLREAVSLPENTKVYVIVAEQYQTPSAHVRTPRLANPKQFGDFRKQIIEVSTDAPPL
jgi:hypothetical protein